MADAPNRIFGFDAHARHARGASVASSGVVIAPRNVATMVNLRGNPHDAEFMRSASAILGVGLPVQPNTVTGTADIRVLWLGPDEWLIVSPRPVISEARLANGAVTDVSHGRAVLRVSGSGVRLTLAKGCPLDLDPRVFGIGTCAQTAIAKIGLILSCVAPHAFEIYCPRSYAGSFWHWLSVAAAEYGCRIEQAA